MICYNIGTTQTDMLESSTQTTRRACVRGLGGFVLKRRYK